MKESTGKRLKNLDDRSRKKKKRNLVMNYLRSLWQNYYMDGEEKDTKRRGRKDKMKIGVNGKISWNKET